MKYTTSHPPIQCFMRQSTWYKGAPTTTVRGVLWHSTGANNPYISRYVQPDDNAPDKAEMLAILGKNRNGNDWNHVYREAGVHAWVGKLTDGTVSTVQVGPWDKKAWGCGPGSNGSCNNGWIQFEICEDGLNDPVYFGKVYQEAVELTAYLCKLYNLDPLGTVIFNGVKAPVILCHQDSYRIGLGGDHSDVYHWFNRYGKTMDDVRADVARVMKGDDEEMTQEKFNEMFIAAMKQYREELANLPAPKWFVNNGEQAQATETGITDGSRPQDLATRCEVAAMIVRAKNA